MEEEYPKVRNVEPIPIIINGEQMMGLRDPHDLKGKGEIVVMSLEAFAILNFFDGKHSITDIQTYLTRLNGGVLFPREEIIKIIEMLDKNYMLENKRYYEKIKEYNKQTIRGSVLANKSIPADIKELEIMLNKLLEKGKKLDKEYNNINSFIAPHIDLYRAEVTYSKVYNILKNIEEQPSIYIIFGTAHYSEIDTFFSFTYKSYETPYGVLPTNKEILNKIKEKVPTKFFENDIIHKGEHSIEFQVLLLQHIFRRNNNEFINKNNKKISVIPILVGSFHEYIEKNMSPYENPEIKETIESLKKVVKELQKQEKICLIASVDLSHVGPRFGDNIVLDELYLEKIKNSDNEAIQKMIEKDAEGFFKTIAKTKNKYKICGVSPIYTLLKIIENENYKGEVLNYDQSVEPETGSVVTFASIIYS